MNSGPALGRPRTFDEDEKLDRAVDVFWRLGVVGTTTRVLETELELTQSSIYNAFGSKNDLAGRVVDRYLDMLDDQIVSQLEGDEVGFADLHRFVDDLVVWISNESRPGCLLLNMLAERGSGDPGLVARAEQYRARLRALFTTILERADVAQPKHQAELLLAAVLGMNVASRSGADRAEIDALAGGLTNQLELLAS